MLTTTQQAVLWVGSGGMALGAVIIGVLSRRAANGGKHHFVTSFAVCAIAAAAYFAMANGEGITRAGTRLVFFARYVDWVLTTPLLLLGLLMVALPAVTGGADAGRERNALIGGVLGADVFMIVTGLAASLTSDKAVKYGWYAISCLAFLAVLAVLWGPVRAAARAQGGTVTALFLRLTAVLTTLWFIYPVLWVLGTEGTGTLSLTGEIIVFAVIDLSAKVGFGLLLCTGVIGQERSVTASGRRQPTPSPATA